MHIQRHERREVPKLTGQPLELIRVQRDLPENAQIAEVAQQDL